MLRKLLFSLLLLAAVTTVRGQELTVASYNIRYYNDGDTERGNGWERRSPWLSSLIEFMDFDLFGAQEVIHNQLQDLLRMLPEYDYIGVGRVDGMEDGEYSPIFYKRERFKLLDSGTFWLSETPEKPSVGWDAALSRICTWGRFLDRKSSRRFWFFNLHMDHVGVRARHNGGELVMKRIREMCSPREAVLLTGDFNVDQTSDVYRVFDDSGMLRDAYCIAAKRYAPNGTFNDFSTTNLTESRIDHVFVSGRVEVLRYGVLTETYRSPVAGSGERISSGNFPREVALHRYEARTPSDHFPVVVRVRLAK